MGAFVHDWDNLRFFLAVERAGTLAGAGAKLGLNATTVGRRLTSLEETLRARLFDRTPDGFVLTGAGESLLPVAERIEAEFLALDREVAGADQSLTGRVRLTATEMLATRFIAPHLALFRERYPQLELDLICSTRVFNLGRREADIALRLARPREENLIIKKLADVHLGLYATHEYLELRGTPDDPDATLAGHDVILFAESRPFAKENAWFEPRLDGARIVLRSDSVSSMYSAVTAGVGLAMLPRQVADRDPRLVRIESRTAPEPRRIWQMIHRDLQGNARVRAVLDFLGEVLGREAPHYEPTIPD